MLLLASVSRALDSGTTPMVPDLWETVGCSLCTAASGRTWTCKLEAWWHVAGLDLKLFRSVAVPGRETSVVSGTEQRDQDPPWAVFYHLWDVLSPFRRTHVSRAEDMVLCLLDLGHQYSVWSLWTLAPDSGQYGENTLANGARWTPFIVLDPDDGERASSPRLQPSPSCRRPHDWLFFVIDGIDSSHLECLCHP